VVINLFNFFRQYKSPPFHTVIRIHLILFSFHILVILPSHFSSMEHMLMFNLNVWVIMCVAIADGDYSLSIYRWLTIVSVIKFYCDDDFVLTSKQTGCVFRLIVSYANTCIAYIVRSLVHTTWFYSHFTSLSWSLYHSYHLISSAIRPTIVQYCLRISLHRVFTLAWLAFTGTVNLLTHLRYYYFISSPHM